MAGSVNKVFLMGNLTRDIELRHTASNTAIAKIGLAVNRKFKTQSGETREEVTFVDCEAWGRTAEVMSQYLVKGRPVFIEGRLRLDQWEDKNDGSKRSRLLVVVDSFQFVDSGGGGGGGGGGGAQSSRPAPAAAGAARGGGSGGGGGGYDEPTITDDDIPF